MGRSKQLIARLVGLVAVVIAVGAGLRWKHRAVVLLLLSGSQASCASVVGTAAGPVSFPISNIRQSHGVGWPEHAVVFPFSMIVGPLVCGAAGVEADFGLVKNGGYGRSDSPPFGVVFDPLGFVFAKMNDSAERHRSNRVEENAKLEKSRETDP